MIYFESEKTLAAYRKEPLSSAIPASEKPREGIPHVAETEELRPIEGLNGGATLASLLINAPGSVPANSKGEVE